MESLASSAGYEQEGDNAIDTIGGKNGREASMKGIRVKHGY